jgi:D-amino-acid oxidase
MVTRRCRGCADVRLCDCGVRVVVIGARVSGLTCARLLLHAVHNVAVVSGDPLTARLPIWLRRCGSLRRRIRQKPSHAGARRHTTCSRPGPRHACSVWSCASRWCSTATPDPSGPLPAWGAARSAKCARRTEMNCLVAMAVGFRFAVPLAEMPSYLPYLHERVLAAGATQVVRRVSGLDDVLDLTPGRHRERGWHGRRCSR